jgi:transposase-like protein
MGKHAKPEEIVAKLCQFEVLTAQGKSIAEAARTIGVSEQTYYRWRADYGSMKMDQVKRLKELETENARLRRAVSDLTVNSHPTATPFSRPIATPLVHGIWAYPCSA